MFVSVRSSGGLGYTNILRGISKYRLTLTNNLENHFKMRFSPGSVVAGRLLVGGGWWLVVVYYKSLSICTTVPFLHKHLIDKKEK